jgi:serine/threonine-protein kinase
MTIGPGARVGPYEVLSKLGAGGMGEVYRARHTRLERDVAIKVLPEHLAGDAQALARFEREARAVAALSHPNILAIHDFGAENGLSYAVMELLDGRTLRERTASGRVPWRDAAEIGVALAEGLAAAHAKGIVHRDLKPENVFVTTDGRVKILDFGLARGELPAGPASSTVSTLAHTTPGTVLGTPGYMSPEQTRGEAAGPPSDIFSLGCVLHELLTGKRTFVRASLAETMAAVLHEDPPPASASDPSIPPRLDALVRQCLEKDPGRRVGSAKNLAAALRAIPSGPLSAEHDARAERRDEGSSRRLRMPAAALALLAAVVPVAAALWLWQSRGRAPAEREVAAATPSVAVLPFQSLAAADGDEYLAEGVAEAVTTDLARIPGLLVINRSSASRYRDKDTDVRKAGAELSVRYLVQGSVQRSGERLRLNAQLVDVSTGYQLWAERYDRELRDVFAVQDEIARSVVQAIEPRLAPKAAPNSRKPPDFQAYDLYLRGRSAWSRRTPESMAEAITLFEQAITRAPAFAEAYAGLADTFLIAGRLRYVRYSEAIPRAQGAAERALALDPELGEAHASLGSLHIDRLEWADAEREYRRAIELKPSHATAHQWYALLLYNLGRLDEGVREATRGTELDPLSVTVQATLAIGLYLKRDFDLAYARVQRASELSPGFPGPFRIMSQIEDARGRLPEALELARRAVEKQAGPVPRATLARMHARLGQAAQARAILAELEREPEPCVACVVDIQLALGDLTAALARVERGGWTTASGYYFPKADPAYDRFRSDPRFGRLLKAIRLQ